MCRLSESVWLSAAPAVHHITGDNQAVSLCWMWQGNKGNSISQMFSLWKPKRWRKKNEKKNNSSPKNRNIRFHLGQISVADVKSSKKNKTKKSFMLKLIAPTNLSDVQQQPWWLETQCLVDSWQLKWSYSNMCSHFRCGSYTFSFVTKSLTAFLNK